MEGRGYGRGSGGSGGGRGRGRQGAGGGNGGRGRNAGGYGRGRNGGGYEQNYQTQYNESWGRGGRGRGYDNRAPQQHSGGSVVGRGVWTARQGGSSSPSSSTAGVWTGKQWGSSSPSSSTAQPQNQVGRQPQYQPQRSHQSPPPADSVGLNFQQLKITEQQQQLSSPENKILPMRRPDRGILAVRSVSLLANHFPVSFNPRSIIMHYDVDIKVNPVGKQSFKRTIPKHLMRSIKDKLFSENPNFPVDLDAYDGEKNIFSGVELPVGEFSVEVSEGEDKISSYIFTIKEVSRLELYRLKEYLGGNISYIPRDILQGMDLVMKDNPSKYRISVGRSFYCKNYRERDDLGYGVAAYRGLFQSLRSTSQGLALCLDYSVLAFRKPVTVLDFLKENIKNFRGAVDVSSRGEEVTEALRGLKVTVTHRVTKQKYTISGLTKDSTRNITFLRVGPDSQASTEQTRLVDYFWEKYNKRIMYLDIPCLDLGKPGKPNQVPMEFCVLVEGQRYPKEQLDVDTAKFLKKISLAPPAERKITICEMVRAEDGPCGIVANNFGIEVEKNMTSVQGRVLGAPELKLRGANGNICPVRVDQEKCQWNLVGKSFVEGQHVERWAVIDFTSTSRFKMRTQEFINKLRQRALRLGMQMEEPLACHLTGMNEFSSVARIEKLLRKVIFYAGQNGGLQGKQLQVIVCIMTGKEDPGYNYLKWVSETQIGVVTQCCLSIHASKGQDQYLANLCLKINAKVGGSNVELNERLPHFVYEDNVMFIGADVNHPAAKNSTCPSIAAVVGTTNWPATNQYAARIQPQEHRKEKILNFGSICRDLVNTFAQHNNSRPKKIIVFRDGVSEGQFEMVLNEELPDLVEAISDEHYRPLITLVVAQKRHHTRLFTDRRDGGVVSGNVPPGTVVDTTIIHPFEFDFYLCSHYGSLGTSKPTHYYVLWDENKFTSDELQKLIYNLCFTHARCTKPVSLVPPVYYADLVAYRGRLYQQVVMERSSGASLDQNFYALHRDLQNMMYFV